MARPNPESVRVSPPNPYVFRLSWKRRFMALVDLVGGCLFAFRATRRIQWEKLERVAVLRLDHLGDVILALPFLEAIKRLAPQAEIDFYVGPWAEPAVPLSNLPIRPVIFSARWFDRSNDKSGSKGIKELARTLKAGKYDLAFDLRGDLRHALSMWMAGIPHRVGYGITGGKFLFTQPIQYQGVMHETDRDLDLLTQAGGIVEKGTYARFYPDEAAKKRARAVKKELGLSRPVIALHATCAATAKRWPEENWRALIGRLPEKYDLVMVGASNEKSDMERIVRGLPRKVFLTAGSLDLPALAAFLSEASLFIGVDSGPAHVAAAVDIPVLSLFSGTNSAAQWSPRGENVTVIQKPPVCSPCARTVCPLEHQCMTSITVQEVIDRADLLQL